MRFSTDQLRIGSQVDKQAEACYALPCPGTAHHPAEPARPSSDLQAPSDGQRILGLIARSRTARIARAPVAMFLRPSRRFSASST